LFGGLAIPRHRPPIVLWHALTLVVQDAKGELGIGIALFGGLAIPRHRCRVVSAHTPTPSVQNAKAVLSSAIALFRKRAQQLQRRCIVASVVGGSPILERSGHRRRSGKYDHKQKQLQ
jgi:hypothetical protein